MRKPVHIRALVSTTRSSCTHARLMQGRNDAAGRSTQDVRDLLRYVLQAGINTHFPRQLLYLRMNVIALCQQRHTNPVWQAFEENGGKVEKPVGCTATEDWLLDAVNVRELLKALGSGEPHCWSLPVSTPLNVAEAT